MVAGLYLGGIETFRLLNRDLPGVDFGEKLTAIDSGVGLQGQLENL